MTLASDTELKDFLDSNPEWVLSDRELQRTYEFSNFAEAMGFVTRVALAAEKADHHPDIAIRWNKVSLTLSTHSEGGITSKDFDLASQL